MAEIEPSYSGLVFRRAWANTWRLLKHKIFDAAVTVSSIAIGTPIFLRFYGPDAVTEEFWRFTAFAMLPAGLFFIFAFLWNLCLASDELVYGEIKRVSQQLREIPLSSQSPRPAASPPPINWRVWREMSVYTVEEFAKILAKVDPVAQSLPHAAATFQRLILEEIATRRLSAVARVITNMEGHSVRLDHGSESEIKRQDALAWAKHKQFAVGHVE